MDFTLLILGMDFNAYYMARCYHEKYGKKAYLIGKNPIWFTSLSNIVIASYFENIWNENEFLRILDQFYNDHRDEKILLVGSTEYYISMISKNREHLKKNFYFNYPNDKLIDVIANKELFYKKFKNNKFIDIPETIFYKISNEDQIKIPFSYPVIIKPADVVSYKQLEFQGKKKIYKVESEQEMIDVISCIKKGNYKGTIIIQEYIPGDDSYLFDSVIYSDSSGKVKRITFAQIGLQEHVSNLVGNAAVLINGYNQFGNTNEIVNKLKDFAESIGYMGFGEFDLKYDRRDNKFKVLEINPRQGRSSYYLTSLGSNLIELLEKDLIEKEVLKFKFLDGEIMLSFVPKRIIKKYILNEEYKTKALKMWKNRVNPLKYNKDKSFARNYNVFRRNLRYYKDYKKGYWKNK